MSWMGSRPDGSGKTYLYDPLRDLPTGNGLPGGHSPFLPDLVFGYDRAARSSRSCTMIPSLGPGSTETGAAASSR